MQVGAVTLRLSSGDPMKAAVPTFPTMGGQRAPAVFPSILPGAPCWLAYSQLTGSAYVADGAAVGVGDHLVG